MANNRFHAAINRESAHTNAHNAITEFGKLNVELPTAVNQAHDALIALETRRPQQPDANAVRELYATAATDKAINEALNASTNHQARHNAWIQARADLGIAVMQQMLSHSNEIHAALAAIATPIIEDITAAAKIDEPLNALVSAGRHNEATLTANAEINVAQLQHLYDLRDRYLTPPSAATSAGHYDGSVWANPSVVHGKARGETTAATWRAGIRAGGQLAFPTHTQALNTATKAWSDYKRLNPEPKAVASHAAF
ncbi:hypothetical protein [Mycolicibacterium sp.]|uniref:hypothetical protein n=1 Tax=Mycolicibacterium sp. TaxID=2320850 RepID=UPI0037C80469